MASPRPPFWEKRDILFFLAFFAGLVVLNSFLISPSIGWYDSGEMIAVTQCLGISHPSGQVFFHLLGKIFLLLPLGTPAFRLGFLSVCCSSLASVLFWALACRLAPVFSPSKKSTAGISPALKGWLLLLTLAWSFSLPWWRYSVMPLVYALHLLLALFLLWVLTLPSPFKWRLAFLVMGVATVFRPTQFFALPFVGLAFLLERRSSKEFSLKSILFLLVSFGMGRSTALYLPLRSALHPAVGYWDLTHPLALFRHVFALRFSDNIGKITVSSAVSILQQILAHLWNDLTPLGAALLLGGLWLLIRHRKRIPVFLWVALGWGALEALFVFTIPYPTFESHQMILGWAFGGFLAALPLVFLHSYPKVQCRRGWVTVVLTALVLTQFSAFPHLLERKRERGAQDYARNLLTIMEPGALYMPAEENEYFAVVGYQQSFNFRKEVEVVEPGSGESLIGPKIKKCLEQGRAFYVTRRRPLPLHWSYLAWGPLWKVVPDSPSPVGRKAPAGRPLAAWGGLELMDMKITPPLVGAGGIVEVSYQWVRRKAAPQDSADMVVAVFIDPKGDYRVKKWAKDTILWFHDIHGVPAGSVGQMKMGVLYEEKRILFVPSDFQPGHYALAIGLQKRDSPRQEGQEPFNLEFYERGGFQDLDKFQGRVENGAVVHFSALTSDSWKDNLWKVTQSRYPIADPRFVPAATLEIK